ncbi:MAG TPA: ferrochelatase [Burkholderiales bacterium]|nr:ferrochelatase [Burkholderiales bacterium]
MAERFRPEPVLEHAGVARDGILLVNLGTPAAPTPGAVRRYLAEFLSDPRVVEIPRALWLPVLYGVILTLRPARSAPKYAEIWTPEGSPLAVHTARQAALLRARLGAQAPEVVHAMRYGEPGVGAGLDRLRAAGCDRILVVPLYPQYAASTTASTCDAVGAWLARTRNLPELRFVKHYHDDPRYVAALAAGVRRHWDAHGRGERLVMSFHGLPRFTLERGDPYHSECQATGRLLAQALDLAPDQYLVTFQSRFGRAEWLQPYTEPTLIALAQQGIGRVDVVCPGFVADCLETLEEIGIGARQAFLTSGGREFQLVPCLNEAPEWIDALAAICAAHGWAPRAKS